MDPTPGEVDHSGPDAHALEAELQALATLEGKAFWTRSRGLQELLRGAHALTLDSRRDMTARLEGMCDRMRAAEARWIESANENAWNLTADLEDLRGWFDAPEEQRRFDDFWDRSRQLRERMQLVNPLRREDRSRLWRELGELSDRVQKEQVAHREARQQRSREEQAQVLTLLDESERLIDAATDPDSLARAETALHAVLERLKAGDRATEARMLRPDHMVCWERYLAARGKLRAHHESVIGPIHARLARRIEECVNDAGADDPPEVFRRVKELQAEMREAHLSHGKFEGFRRQLNTAWERASARLDEHRREMAKQREDWIKESRERLTRIEALHEKNVGVIARLTARADDIAALADRSKNEAGAANLRGEEAELRQKIAAIAQTNRRLEGQIRSLTSKVGRTDG